MKAHARQMSQRAIQTGSHEDHMRAYRSHDDIVDNVSNPNIKQYHQRLMAAHAKLANHPMLQGGYRNVVDGEFQPSEQEAKQVIAQFLKTNVQESRMKLPSMRSLLSERFLREDATGDDAGTAPPTVQPSQKEGGDSLDNQVDRYLAEYEASSKTAKHEGRDFKMMIRRLLSEAGDDDAESDGPDADAGGEDAAPAPAAAPPKETIDEIDMEEFANNVARLIENYENLLEVRSTLVRRSINFISKNYDQTAVTSLESLLRDKHGMADGETKQEVDDELFQAPRADRAGPGGAGA